MRFERTDFLFLLFWILAAVLLLTGLGHTLLWQDEAHTAVLGQRILSYGFPKVWDGRNLVTGMNGLDFNQAYALTWDGWLPYYIASASIQLLGPNPIAARLPFALVAVFTVPLLYRFVVRLTADKTLAFWSAFFLVASMTFLLHGRQCRYFALLPFATLLVFHGVLSLPRWSGRWLLAFGLILLYHSNLLGFALVLIALALTPVFFDTDKEKFKAALAGLFIAFAATFPMFLYARAWEKSSGFQSSFGWGLYALQVAGDLILWNKFHLPLVLLVLGLLFGRRLFDAQGKKFFAFIAVLVALSLFLIPFKFYANNRYFLPLLPASALGLALFHVSAWRRSKVAGVFLFFLIVATHAWDYLPEKAVLWATRATAPRLSQENRSLLSKGYEQFRNFDDEEGPSSRNFAFNPLYVPTFGERFWRSDYRSLIHEIRTPFADGLQEVSDFLKAHRGVKESVYVSVGQYPLLFLDPEIRLAYTISDPTPWMQERLDPSQWEMERIDWFVPRFYRQMRGPHLTEEEFLDYVRKKGWTTEKFELKTPEIQWEGNWPYWYRLYRIKQGEFPILNSKPTVIYHVVRSPSTPSGASAIVTR